MLIFIRERLSPELAVLAAEVPPNVLISNELSHPLVLKTEKLLSPGKENDKGQLVPKSGNALHVLVSRAQAPRALRIINALFQGLEERGYAPSWPKDDDEKLMVGVDGEAVAVSILEVLDCEAHKLTPSEQARSWRVPKWDYKPTGRLKLSIDNLPHFQGSSAGLMGRRTNSERELHW